MAVQVFSSFEMISDMQEEWDSFVAAHGADIFMTYDWCRIWWKYYGGNRRLLICLFREQDELVGILPVFLDSIRIGLVRVRAVKIVGSDFTLSQFNLPVDASRLDDVFRDFSRVLERHKWDLICLGPIAGICKLPDRTSESLKKTIGQSSSVLLKERGVQTYYEVPATWDKYLSKLSKNDRKNIGRYYRRLPVRLESESESVLAEMTDNRNLQQWFDEFVRMHTVHWHAIGKLGHFGDWPASLEFHREMIRVQAERGRVRLLRISLGDLTLAYEYAYRMGQTYFAVLSARYSDERLGAIGLGKISHSELTRSAMAEGVSLIDSMRGDYEHKKVMGGQVFPLKSVFVLKRNPVARLRVLCMRRLSRLLNFCYFRIWFARLAPRLPFKRRPLWRQWIVSRFLSW